MPMILLWPQRHPARGNQREEPDQVQESSLGQGEGDPVGKPTTGSGMSEGRGKAMDVAVRTAQHQNRLVDVLLEDRDDRPRIEMTLKAFCLIVPRARRCFPTSVPEK